MLAVAVFCCEWVAADGGRAVGTVLRASCWECGEGLFCAAVVFGLGRGIRSDQDSTPWGYQIEGRDMAEVEYQITGMTCGHCEMSVREEVGEVAGVNVVSVSADTGVLVVESAAEIDDALIVAAVDEAGYAAVRRP